MFAHGFIDRHKVQDVSVFSQPNQGWISDV